MTNNEFLSKAKENGITNIQVVETTQNIGKVELINKGLDTFEVSNYMSYQIKAEYNGKTVKAASDYLDESILDLLIMKATETDSNYQDDYLQDTSNNNEIITTPQIEISKDLDTLRKLDDIRKQYKEVSNLTLLYSEIYTKKHIFNSNGVNIETDSHVYKFTPEIVIPTEDGVNDYDRVYLKTSKDGLLGVKLQVNEIFVPVKTPLDVITHSWDYLVVNTKLMLLGLWQLVSGKIPLSDMHGIVAITKVGGDIIENSGMLKGLLLSAIISIDLAIINLLPIPALDGGHLMFLALEKLVGRELDEKIVEGISRVFFTLLILLMIYVVFNDIFALVTKQL